VRDTNKKEFTALEAATLTRFFVALERIIQREFERGDAGNAGAIARLMGGLHYRCFEVTHCGDSFGVEA